MTFRPSDDISNNQDLSLNKTDFWVQDGWQSIFNHLEDSSRDWIVEGDGIAAAIMNSPVEEIKAPNLSDLLKNSWWDFIEDEKNINKEEDKSLASELLQEKVDSHEVAEKSDIQVINSTESKESNGIHPNDEEKKVNDDEVLSQEEYVWQQNKLVEYDDLNKTSDEERSAIVSSIIWAINSNLDYLVDGAWFAIITTYKKLNRLFFRWWIFVCVVIIGILSWVFLQVKASTMGYAQLLDGSSIENMSKWVEETPDKLLSSYVENSEVDVAIPYGSISVDWTFINSKSNFVFYKWLVLPQLVSMDYNSDNLISLDDFNLKNITRNDIETLVSNIITNNSIYKKTTNIPNANSSRWVWNRFLWSLRDGFNLSCVGSQKMSDFVCDKFLENFYKYGKYYDLNEYAPELLNITVDLKKQGKDISPICSMIKEYTLHVGNSSDTLIYIMEYCGENDLKYYKKMVDFIDIEKSLWQPELSTKVYEDPDLNAYKLLSAQQIVYKILDWTSLNEGYIKSYLEFVQLLIDKDKGSNRYLHPIYKDMLYVFNMDELYQKLMKKWRFSSDLNLQIIQINNWDGFWSVSLLSQLTTPDIVQSEWDFGDTIVNQKTLEEIFAQYYAMTDRLKIRKANIISDDEIKVQTEVFTDKILNATDGQTLKVTVVLRRQNDLLYVDSIKVANQPKFTDILDIYLKGWNITFYAMLNYIDEQVWMWYEVASEDLEEQPGLCETLMQMENIDVYSCDDSSISLYKWEIGYDFVLEDWVLVSFTITDENLDQVIKDKLDGVLFMRDSTPSMITSIIDFTIESEDGNLERKLEIIDQFRIHFKLAPNYVYDVEGNSDEFLVDFTLWDFNLQGRYNINTHILTKISYTNCPKPLEIKQLSLEITSENEPQLIEILNNPRVFFANVNPLIYSKYKNACWGNVVKKKQ